MRVFVSYAREDEGQFARLAERIRAHGFEVFDPRTLEKGEAYDERIAAAIDCSDAFVFLASRSSLTHGKYTLSELRLAQRRWPNPSGALVPVLLDDTEIAALPSYLTSVSVLQQGGNIEVEVVDALTRFRRRQRRRILRLVRVAALAAGALSVAAVLLAYWVKPGYYVHRWTVTRTIRTVVPDQGPSLGALGRCAGYRHWFQRFTHGSGSSWTIRI